MFGITVEHDLERVSDFAKAIQKQLAKPDLSGAPAQSALKHFRRILTGGKFAPITEATRKIRAQRGQSGGRPLNVSGGLLRSIKVLDSRQGALRVGSPIARAAFLRFGGITATGSAISGKSVPERDFLEVTQPLLTVMAQGIFSRLRT